MSTETAMEPLVAGAIGHEWDVRAAVRLGRRLLLAGRFDGLRTGHEVVLGSASAEQRLTAQVWSEGRLSLVAIEPEVKVTGGEGHWFGEASGDRLARVPEIGPDIGAILREGPTSLGPTSRAAIMSFLLDVTDGAGSPAVPLATSLHTARQVLRPRVAPSVVSADGDRGLKIEVVGRVDERTVYMRGWIGYSSAALASVTAVSPEGSRAEVLATIHRYPRRDVAHFYGEPDDEHGYGFAVMFAVPHSTVLAGGWVLEIRPLDGTPVEGTGPEAITDHLAVRNLLVADLVLERGEDESLRRDHISKAISRVLRSAQDRVHVTKLVEYGDVPSAPDVSIIVPLYRRIDLVDHQLAHFAHDPEIARADLLYVLDSPELDEGFLAEAHRLFRFYRVPFRVAVLSQNGGFSTANNRGADLARGRLLLLMNSDVMPDRPGWLSKLVEIYDHTPQIGALGPKLLYEDESIQHAGMYFERPIRALQWGNEHYFKGFHRTFAPACVSRRVPAVTAACLMIAADLYRDFDGLRGMYVQGDFEDSDLCLRLSQAGYEHWYAADVELYHLEGQSYPTSQRVANGSYNRWLHTHLWDGQIASEMAKETFA